MEHTLTTDIWGVRERNMELLTPSLGQDRVIKFREMKAY